MGAVGIHHRRPWFGFVTCPVGGRALSGRAVGRSRALASIELRTHVEVAFYKLFQNLFKVPISLGLRGALKQVLEAVSKPGQPP